MHFLGGRAAQAVARGVLLLVLVRLLDVADYGAYMLIVGLSEMLLQVASFGILPVGQRYLPQMLTTLPRVRLYRFVTTLIFAQLAILVILAAVLWLSWATITPYMGFSEQQTADTQIGVWLFLLVPAFRFSVELLDALLEQGRAQLTRALMPLIRAIVIGVLVLAAAGIDLHLILALDGTVTFACLMLAWVFLGRSLSRLHNSSADGEIPVSEISRFAWHMATVGLFSATASPGALRLVLANALGVAESGLFAFLQSLTRLVSRYLPGTLLRGLIRPILVSRALDQDGTAKLQAGAGLLLKTNLIIVAGAAIVIATGGNQLVYWISGGKFEGAGLTLLLMFASLGITSQRAVIEMVMQITGHTSTLRMTSVIWPVSLLAIWYYAHLGLNVAIIMAVAAAVANWIAMSVLRKSSGAFAIDWRGLAMTLLAATLGIAVGLLLKGSMHFLLAGAIGLLTYTAILWFADPYKKSEVELVERAIGKKGAAVLRGFSRL